MLSLSPGSCLAYRERLWQALFVDHIMFETNNTQVFPSALCSRSPCNQGGLVASQAVAAHKSIVGDR